MNGDKATMKISIEKQREKSTIGPPFILFLILLMVCPFSFFFYFSVILSKRVVFLSLSPLFLSRVDSL